MVCWPFELTVKEPPPAGRLTGLLSSVQTSCARPEPPVSASAIVTCCAVVCQPPAMLSVAVGEVVSICTANVVVGPPVPRLSTGRTW